jgi:hypothetical protein
MRVFLHLYTGQDCTDAAIRSVLVLVGAQKVRRMGVANLMGALPGNYMEGSRKRWSGADNDA